MDVNDVLARNIIMGFLGAHIFNASTCKQYWFPLQVHLDPKDSMPYTCSMIAKGEETGANVTITPMKFSKLQNNSSVEKEAELQRLTNTMNNNYNTGNNKYTVNVFINNNLQGDKVLSTLKQVVRNGGVLNLIAKKDDTWEVWITYAYDGTSNNDDESCPNIVVGGKRFKRRKLLPCS